MSFIADGEMSAIILNNALTNAHFASKVIPYLKPEYFNEDTERAIAGVMTEFYVKYGKCPQVKEVVVELKELPQITQLDKQVVNDVLGNSAYAVTDPEWLISHTEKFIRRRRVSEAFNVTYGDFESGGEIDTFANVFQEALSFHFDNSIGHNFLEDAHVRYDMYTSVEERVSFGLEMLDLVTNGGMGKGTLNVFLAGTGVGKSLMMCSLAAAQAMAGKRVLYISMEMAEMRLAERLEANLMDVALNDIAKMSKGDFTVRQRIYTDKMRANGGNIIFKQYPTSSAHVGHFRNLLIEAKNKQNMEFDIIYVDYLNICDTARGNSGDNSYTKIKNIAEELRGLAVEWNLPIVSATQTNRGGQTSTDLGFEDVSESHGLAATVDALFSLMSNEEWERTNKLMIGQVKNRYGDTNFYKKFMVGIERAKMRIYDIKREASDVCNAGQSKQAEINAVTEFGAGGLDLSALGVSKTSTNTSGLKT
jgi:replicative DNA helicase